MSAMNTRTMHRTTAAAAAATILTVVALTTACTSDRPPPGAVTVSVMHAETAAVPGRSLALAWRFRIADGWHLYGDARNDSGLPPTVALDLPEGWTAEPPLWPGTERLESPGGIVDHVYADELVLLQRVVVSPHAEFGTEAEITGRVSWLACREACVPGDTTLTVALPVRAHAGPTLDSSLISRLRGALPRPPDDGEIETTRGDGVVGLRAPGAARLEFHPSPDCVLLVDVLADAAADGEALALRFRPGAAGGSVRGVLRITSSEGIVSFLALNVPVEGDRS